MSTSEAQVMECSMSEAAPQSVLSSSLRNECISSVLSSRRDALSLIQVGTKLFTAGLHNDAMTMYDSAVQALITSFSSDSITRSTMVNQQIDWGRDKLKGSVARTQSSFQEHPLDTYQEGECDVGPRPFRYPIHFNISSGSTTDAQCVEAILFFNRALVHHAKSELPEATATYAVALYHLSCIPIPALEDVTQSSDLAAELGMLINNNLGQIKYVEGDEEEALTHFLSAISWARQVRTQREDKEYRLRVANIMSNCCRTQWMSMDTSDDNYGAFAQVLRVRSSVLPWNHLDVASAHYNLGVMEFVRGSYEHARYHLEQYIKVNDDRKKRGEEGINVVSALAYILLIKNDTNVDAQSIELVRCLRLLLDKKEEYGNVHSEVATILNYIGALLFQRKELDCAIEFYYEELRVEQQLLASKTGTSDEPLSLAVTLNNIGRILQERGTYDDAIKYYKKALKTECRVNKTGAELAASIAEGRMPSTFDATNDANASSTANLFATIWYNLGLIHDLKDSPKEAIRSFQMSLGLRRALLGSNHPDVACLFYNIGTLQMENNMLTEASASLRESLRIRRMGVPCEQNDTHIVSTLQKLASLHQSRGNTEDAIEAYSQVLEIQRTTTTMAGNANMKSLEVGITLRAISELQHAEGDVDGALDTADQSLSAFSACPSLRDATSAQYLACVEHVGTVLLSVGSLYHERCDPIQAAVAYKEAERILAKACQATSPPPPTLLPLLELSKMLAFAQCAPAA